MDRTQAIDHVTLTVSHLDRTKSFYEQLFQAKFTKHKSNSFHLLPVGIPVWFVQWEKQHPNDRFDETRIGLDHIAFHSETVEVLEKFVNRLTEMGIETAGIQRYDGKFPYITFRDPDNIQVEFFIPKEM
ncbi:MAG: VOC family protein [Patescibacteria group bacterium]